MCLKRVIITGATGFLGRYLLSHLVGSFDLVSVSRTSGAGVVQAPNYASVPDGDLLIHLAEESDRAAANRAGEAHVEASTRVARALSRRFEGRMIYASSAVVYGDAAGHARGALHPHAVLRGPELGRHEHPIPHLETN